AEHPHTKAQTPPPSTPQPPPLCTAVSASHEAFHCDDSQRQCPGSGPAGNVQQCLPHIPHPTSHIPHPPRGPFARPPPHSPPTPASRVKSSGSTYSSASCPARLSAATRSPAECFINVEYRHVGTKTRSFSPPAAAS